MALNRLFHINLGGDEDPIPDFRDYFRAGQDAISDGSQTLSILFSTPLGDTNYSILASIINLTDVDPIFLQIVGTVKTANGFTVEFNAPADTANYVLEWLAAKDI